MNTILIAIAVGAVIGGAMGLLPNTKIGCAMLLIIPSSMLLYAASLGALAGFTLTWLIRSSTNLNGEAEE